MLVGCSDLTGTCGHLCIGHSKMAEKSGRNCMGTPFQGDRFRKSELPREKVCRRFFWEPWFAGMGFRGMQRCFLPRHSLSWPDLQSKSIFGQTSKEIFQLCFVRFSDHHVLQKHDCFFGKFFSRSGVVLRCGIIGARKTAFSTPGILPTLIAVFNVSFVNADALYVLSGSSSGPDILSVGTIDVTAVFTRKSDQKLSFNTPEICP